MNGPDCTRPAAPPPSALDAGAMARHAGNAAALLRSLANEQRLLVLCHLAGGELSVGQLLQHVELSQSALSQHLAILRDAGFVTTRRRAQQVFYSLAEGPAQQVMHTLHGIYCKEESR